jgi:xylulokinase
VGVAAPGSAFVSLGTSGVLFAANAGFSPNPQAAVHAFCHALPRTWHQMGVILSATGSLDWLAGILDTPAPDLVATLGERASGPSPVRFLPYLSGERTPHNDARARGLFTGLAHETGREAMVQAVLEGVAFAFADSQDALAAAGTTIDRAIAVGGGSRSRYWLSTVATVLGIPIDVLAEGDFGAAFGAARLGLVAATGADPFAVCAPPPVRDTIEPDPALRDAYAEALGRWRALYPAVKEAMA